MHEIVVVTCQGQLWARASSPFTILPVLGGTAGVPQLKTTNIMDYTSAFLKNISDIWLFQELCYFPLFLIRPNYSPYAACSSRRARVCSMLSSWGAVQVSSLISPHCVYQPKCRLRRTRGAALSVWLLIVAEKNRPAAQMHRLACAELRADGEKWLVYQMWAKNNSANDLSNLFKFVQQILNRLEWHWSIK